MNFMDKLCIFLSLHNGKYSQYVNEFIRSLVSEGELIGRDRYRVEIKWRGVHYGVWIENYPYADLSYVKRYNDNTIFYSDLRPSRATQIAFWEWMEKKGIYPGNDSSVLQEKNVKALLTGIKNVRKESCPKN